MEGPQAGSIKLCHSDGVSGCPDEGCHVSRSTSQRSVQAKSQKASFFEIFEIFLEFLRGLHIEGMEAEYGVHWTDDLRLQKYFREWHARSEDKGLHDEEKSGINTVLSILRTLNSLNTFTHACTRRVLSYKFKVSLQPPPLEDFEIPPLLDGPMHTFELVDLERPIRNRFWNTNNAEAVDMHPHASDQLFQTLPATLPSLRIFSIEFNSLQSARMILSKMMSIAPDVEELSVTFAGPRSRQVEELFGEGTDFNKRWTLPNYSSLRVIRFMNFSLENFGENDGLPPDFSCLLQFESLEAVHFYRSMFPREAEVKDFRHFIRKLSWTRKMDEAFALDSVYVDVVRRNFGLLGRERSELITQLIKKAPNLTLEVSNDYASDMTHIVLPAWSSLQSLTIITDDFPNPDLLRHAPTSIDMLVIAFQGCRCRYEPLFLDRRILGFLRPRTTRNVRICISSSKDESIFGRLFLGLTHDTHSLFFTPSEELFGETRALCEKRGGQFILENLFEVSADAQT